MTKYDINDLTKRKFYIGFTQEEYKVVDLHQNFNDIKDCLLSERPWVMPFCDALIIFQVAIDMQGKIGHNGDNFCPAYLYDEDGNLLRAAYTPDRVVIIN